MTSYSIGSNMNHEGGGRKMTSYCMGSNMNHEGAGRKMTSYSRGSNMNHEGVGRKIRGSSRDQYISIDRVSGARKPKGTVWIIVLTVIIVIPRATV